MRKRKVCYAVGQVATNSKINKNRRSNRKRVRIKGWRGTCERRGKIVVRPKSLSLEFSLLLSAFSLCFVVSPFSPHVIILPYCRSNYPNI